MERDNRGPQQEETERLQKVLARAGVASRRHAEQLILEGRVTVNGHKVLAMGTKVSRQDRVQVDGRSVYHPEGLAYYLLHKPVKVITSVQDPQGRTTVLDLLKDVPLRIYPVGRLDYETSGLLLLTNDGELAHRLLHPAYGVEKTYRARVQGPVEIKALEALRRGVELKDGKTAPAVVERVVLGEAKRQGLEVLDVTIHEGRNRQVRRMLAAVGYPVLELQRVKFGGLTLEKSLPAGAYRPLTAAEVQALRCQVGLLNAGMTEK